MRISHTFPAEFTNASVLVPAIVYCGADGESQTEAGAVSRLTEANCKDMFGELIGGHQVTVSFSRLEGAAVSDHL